MHDICLLSKPDKNSVKKSAKERSNGHDRFILVCSLVYKDTPKSSVRVNLIWNNKLVFFKFWFWPNVINVKKITVNLYKLHSLTKTKCRSQFNFCSLNVELYELYIGVQTVWKLYYFLIKNLLLLFKSHSNIPHFLLP